MKYVKKPIPVEISEPWLKHGDNPDVGNEQWKWANTTWYEIFFPHYKCLTCGRPADEHGTIGTLEGGHVVCPGDRIVTGVRGEKYPIKPGIFEETYKPAE